jgi:hypothetical protein
MRTPANWSPSMSVKPKSLAFRVNGLSSRMPIVLSVPDGASFTAVTSKRSVFGLASVSTPPFAVPPVSRTRNVKLAWLLPLAFAAGVNTNLFAAMSAAVTNCPAVTAAPSSVRLPAAGRDEITTPAKAWPSMSV